MLNICCRRKRLLPEKGLAEPDVVDSQSEKIGDYHPLRRLMEGIEARNTDLVHEVLSGHHHYAMPFPVNHLMKKSGLKPIHVAAKHGSIRILNLLIQFGADINAKTLPHGNTPLLLSLSMNHISFSRKLIQCGADLDIENDEGFSARSILMSNRSIDWVDELWSDIYGPGQVEKPIVSQLSCRKPYAYEYV